MFVKLLTKRNSLLHSCFVVYVVCLYFYFRYRQNMTFLIDRKLFDKKEQYAFKHNNRPQIKEQKTEFRCLKIMSDDLCRTCLSGWSGRDCGIPPHPKSVKITERENGRYIVQVSIVNHELDMLRLKIENSLPFTDEFITIEGDKTFALEPKPYFVDKIANNLSSLIKLRQHHVHIKTTDKYSWRVQDEMRLVNTSIHQIFEDIPLNSVVVFTDLDEVFRPQMFYFLKYYDAFPFPTGVDLDTYLFGYFFHESRIIKLSSLGNVFQSPISIRAQQPTWTIPKGGWHCSWCFTIEGIQMKLKSSPFVDLPRIADNSEFFKPSVIYDHVIKGKWFLGNKYIALSQPKDIPKNTPIYMRSHDWWKQHPPNN